MQQIHVPYMKVGRCYSRIKSSCTHHNYNHHHNKTAEMWMRLQRGLGQERGDMTCRQEVGSFGTLTIMQFILFSACYNDTNFIAVTIRQYMSYDHL